MTSGRLEPDDGQGPGSNSACNQQGDEQNSEIVCGSYMQELMETVTCGDLGVDGEYYCIVLCQDTNWI
jgi:hypothetical protein